MNNATQRYDRYPGARPFEDREADRRVFFGRERELHQLFHQLLTTDLLVLFGKSGLGKTSLLQAALYPRLRSRDLLPLTIRFSDTKSSPLELLYTAIAEQCRRQDIDYTRGETTGAWEFFKTASFLRGEALQTPVLVLDQFEELFTLQSADRRREIVQALAELMSPRPPARLRARRREGAEVPYSDQPPDVKILLSLREDYLGELQALADDIPAILGQRFRLTAFEEDQAKEALEKPSRVEDERLFSTHVFSYDEATIEGILRFLKGRSGIIEPFQLQLLCRHVEQQVQRAQEHVGTNILVDARYLGGDRAMTAILQNFYRDTIRQLPSRRQRNRAHRLCEEGLLNRQNQRISLEERQLTSTYGVDMATLDALVDARLLRKEPRLESFYYELSHDSLIEPVASSRRFRIPKRVLYGGLGGWLSSLSSDICWCSNSNTNANWLRSVPRVRKPLPKKRSKPAPQRRLWSANIYSAVTRRCFESISCNAGCACPATLSVYDSRALAIDRSTDRAHRRTA